MSDDVGKKKLTSMLKCVGQAVSNYSIVKHSFINKKKKDN